MPDGSINSPPQGRRFWTPWTVVWIVCWVGLFTVMHMPVPPGARLPFRLADKFIHVAAYFTLALVGSRSATSRRVALSPGWLARWAVIYSLYAAADELLQPIVGRNCSFTDWLADMLGVAAGLTAAYLMGRDGLGDSPRRPR